MQEEGGRGGKGRERTRKPKGIFSLNEGKPITNFFSLGKKDSPEKGEGS